MRTGLRRYCLWRKCLGLENEILESAMSSLWLYAVSFGTPDGEMFSFGYSASKKQEVLSFLRQGLWQRTDRRLMPWRYWLDLIFGIRQAPFGDFKVLSDDRQCVPKSWVLSRKLRTSSFFPESHPKENISPSDWFWLNLRWLNLHYGSYFTLCQF